MLYQSLEELAFPQADGDKQNRTHHSYNLYRNERGKKMDINAKYKLSGTALMMRYVNQQIARAHDDDKESTINYKVGNPIQGFTDIKVVVTIEVAKGQKQINVDVSGLE